MRIALLCVLCGIGLVGCTKTVKHDVAVFDLAPGKISQPAPASAKYAIKFAPAGEDNFDKIPATQIRVDRGTVMGFESTPTGVVAFAGTQRIVIDVPEGSTLKWQAKSKKHTKFATNLRRARQYTMWGASAVGAAMLDSAVDDLLDDVGRSKESKNQKHGKEEWTPHNPDAEFRLISDLYWATLKEAAERK